MDVNDNACFLNKRAALEFIASKLAPTETSPFFLSENRSSPALVTQLVRPVKPDSHFLLAKT